MTDHNTASSPESTAMHQPPKERLIIRDIDVENFKSYAGVHRIGPFHKTFTCIIGPNGSGKSNVIDAMLFVFGKNAKKIRLEKLSELIHNSAAHPDLMYASVTVNFVEVIEETEEARKDPDQRREVPGSLLTVKREVYRNNASQYYINGTKTTQKEVVSMLIQRGVDLDHNRFLILQGEVEQISMMKPKAEKENEEGLLEYLDDLIGTNQYLEKITAAAQELDKIQEERLVGLDNVRRAEADRNTLEGAKNSALQYVTKRNQLARLVVVLCQLRIKQYEEKLEAPRASIRELNQQIAALQEEVQQHEAERTALEKKRVTVEKDLSEAQKLRDAKLNEKLAREQDLEKERTAQDEDDKQVKKENDRQKKIRDELQKMLLQRQDAERDIAVHERNLAEAQQVLAELVPQLESQAEALSAAQAPIRMELEKAKKALQPFAREVTQAREAKATAEDRLQRLEDDRGARHRDAAKQQSLLHNLDDTVKRLQQELEALEADNTHLKLRDAQRLLKQSIDRKLSINSQIEEVKRSYLDGESDDKMAELLLSERSLKGYYGTLRQLGSIDEAYDIAAGVASNQWGFHVVDDEDTGTRVLEFLRTHKARGSIIVLSQVVKRNADKMDTKFVMPRNVQQSASHQQCTRLFDLIKPTNPKFLPAFYNAVRDTLVVDDIQFGRQVAYGNGVTRYRVVTKQGVLFEQSGALTGGGAARHAKLRAARSPSDQAAVKETLVRLQGELREALDAENNVRDQVRRLEEHIHQQQHGRGGMGIPEQIRQLRSQLVQQTASLNLAKERYEELKNELHTLDSDRNHQAALQRAKAEVADAISALEAAEKKQLQFKLLVEQTEAKLQNAASPSYAQMQADVQQAQKKRDTADHGVHEAKKSILKVANSHERKEKELVESQAKLKELEAHAAERKADDLQTLQQRIQEAAKEFLAREKEVAAVEQRAAEIKQQLTAETESVRHLKLSQANFERDIHAIELTMQSNLQAITSLETRLVSSSDELKQNIRIYGIQTYTDHLSTTALQDQSGEAEDAAPHNRKRARESGGAAEEASSSSEEDDDPTVPPARRHRRRDGSRRAAADEYVPMTASHEPSEDEILAMQFTVSDTDLEQYDAKHTQHLATVLHGELQKLQDSIDLESVAMWRERDIIYRKEKDAYDRIRERLGNAEDTLGELKDRRTREFLASFAIIQKKLKEMYRALTFGGDAEVELVDSLDPFEGVNFVVRPPKKSWKQVSNLSGGEKTLASLALVFALHHVKPTPIYVMDEIDAALDFRNVSIVANYVLRQATGAQFIIISLRNNMFELAHQLVGICKVKDVTRSVGLHPRRMQQQIERMLVEQKNKIETERRRNSGTLGSASNTI